MSTQHRAGHARPRRRRASSRRRLCCATGSRRCATCRNVRRSSSEGSGSFDVLGLWQGEPGGNVQVFRVREGALVDRQTFFVENTAGREARELVEEFALELLRRRREHSRPGDRAARRGRRRACGRAVGAARRARRGAPRAAWPQAPAARDGAAQRRAGGAEEEARLARTREAREEALVRLRDALGLTDLPLRIECYDISNLGRAARGRLDGGLRRRPPAQGALPQVRDPHGRRPGRLRHDARGGRAPPAAARGRDDGAGTARRERPRRRPRRRRRRRRASRGRRGLR